MNDGKRYLAYSMREFQRRPCLNELRICQKLASRQLLAQKLGWLVWW